MAAVLKGYWKFDEVEGDVATDSSGNGHNASLNKNGTWVAGPWNNALSFDGSLYGVALAHADFNFNHDSEFSWCCWLKKNHDGHIITKWKDSTHYINLEIIENEIEPYPVNVYVTIRGNVSLSAIGATISDNEWHFVVFTYDGLSLNTSIKMYLDGYFVETSNNTATPEDLGLDDTHLTIGGYNASNPTLDGSLDEVRIYSGVLTAQQVENLYLYNSIYAPPSVPTPIYPADSETEIPVDFNFTWEGDEGATFGIQVATDENFVDKVINEDEISVMNYSASLESNKKYYWRINSSNESATSAWSATMEFSTARGEIAEEIYNYYLNQMNFLGNL